VAGRLREAVEGIAPSLIKYTDGADGFRRAESELGELASRFARGGVDSGSGLEEVRLLRCPPEGDERLVAALMFSAGESDYESCFSSVRAMGSEERADLARASFRHLRCWDPLVRAFEEVHLTFELVVSASCFAQLKRHRMAMLISQPYDPKLGVTIPPAVVEAGLELRFGEAMARSEELYALLRDRAPEAAAYALSNAHRRRVLFSCNLRELYHFARLRLDVHAQWDIRAVSSKMIKLVSERLPLATMMVCGKDGFESRYEEVFGKPPETG